MHSTNFIFSEKRSDRILRHLLFWIGLSVYFTFLHAANPMLLPASSYFSNFPSVFIRGITMQIPQACCAYGMLYVVLPLFMKKKNPILPLFYGILIWMASAGISIFVASKLTPNIMNALLPAPWQRTLSVAPTANLLVGLFSITKGLFTGAGFLIMLHFVKQWYMKEQRNLQLLKENAASQLKLLTAQVHPHFLFNTLNNIYSKTQNESVQGSKMIMELSDILRYIFVEGQKSRVPLQQELQLVGDYINLEKIRYGSRLDLHLSLPSETNELQIAPLLLLPFVENCFQQGNGNSLSASWINLKIVLSGRQLSLKLMKGKDPQPEEMKTKWSMGIVNVKKRLEHIYPDKHELQISDEQDVIVVNLRMELEGDVPESLKKLNVVEYG